MCIFGHRRRRRHDHQIRIPAVLIGAAADDDVPVHEIHRMGHVQCLGIGLVLIPVDQDDLLAQTLVQNRIRNRAPDIAAAHDYHFAVLETHVILLAFLSIQMIPAGYHKWVPQALRFLPMRADQDTLGISQGLQPCYDEGRDMTEKEGMNS